VIILILMLTMLWSVYTQGFRLLKVCMDHVSQQLVEQQGSRRSRDMLATVLSLLMDFVVWAWSVHTQSQAAFHVFINSLTTRLCTPAHIDLGCVRLDLCQHRGG